MKIRVAIIVDNLRIRNWQANAIKQLNDQVEIINILNCTNSSTKKKLLKNLFYYILNFFSLQNTQTKKIRLPEYGAEIINFKSEQNKNWQKIPKKIVEKLKIKKIDLILKFGLNLLEIDEEIKKIPVFSFHHGDPSKFRGRPAGFYEIFNGVKKTGIIVQKLSNNLDSGKVYAYGESKNLNYSYKKTAINFYSISPFLLRKAVINFKKGFTINIKNTGKNYKLPSNTTVLLFCVKIINNLIKKILYGLFYEKKWMISIMKNKIYLEKKNLLSSNEFEMIPLQKKYNFYSDPFFSFDYKIIRCEGLKTKTGLGDILEIDSGNVNKQRTVLSGKHYSYPFSFQENNKEYVLPEVATHSNPFYISSENQDNSIKFLKGFENKRIVDATLFYNDGFWYIFFGFSSNSQNLLNLYIAKNLDETFLPHPCSPICISPSRSRMAGNIISNDNSLYRLGQNNEGEYGDGIYIHKIMKIDQFIYEEKVCGEVVIDSRQGPHCLNFDEQNDKIILDSYENKFSLLAGYRRVLAKIVNR